METNTDTTTTYSPRTGRFEACGTCEGKALAAHERQDGSWSWLGDSYPSLEAARKEAKRQGF